MHNCQVMAKARSGPCSNLLVSSNFSLGDNTVTRIWNSLSFLCRVDFVIYCYEHFCLHWKYSRYSSWGRLFFSWILCVLHVRVWVTRMEMSPYWWNFHHCLAHEVIKMTNAGMSRNKYFINTTFQFQCYILSKDYFFTENKTVTGQ